jgi:hypothetical protein
VFQGLSYQTVDVKNGTTSPVWVLSWSLPLPLCRRCHRALVGTCLVPDLFVLRPNLSLPLWVWGDSQWSRRNDNPFIGNLQNFSIHQLIRNLLDTSAGLFFWLPLRRDLAQILAGDRAPWHANMCQAETESLVPTVDVFQWITIPFSTHLLIQES